MDEGGTQVNAIRADFCPGRRIKIQFQGVGAHHCPLREEMDLHVAFATGWRGIIVFRAIEFLQRFNGACKLRFRPVSIRRIILSSAPTRWIFLVGATMMKTCILLGAARCRGSLYNDISRA